MKEMKSMLKNKKGITLIALIITIIVLLILAGVVINMTLGNDGIIGKVQGTVDKYQNAQEKEQIEILRISNKINLTNNNSTITYKIVYHANNGTEDKKIIIATNKEKSYAIENTYSKKRYQFIGWSTDQFSNTIEYSVGDEIISNNKDIDLYAIWEIEQIDFYWKFHGDGDGIFTEINKNKNEDLILPGNENVPVFYSNKLNLQPNKAYIIEFDYCCASGINKFNVDFFPDTLPEINPIATTTKQHYKWFIHSNNSSMSSCDLRFFDDQIESQESDITISNIKLYEAQNICNNIDLNFEEPITILGDVAVPCINSKQINLQKSKTYIVEFDYYCLSGSNQFDVDLYPDSLPQTLPTATTTNQHYLWEISSSSNDMLSCRLRFFDDVQESYESNIIISNIYMYEKP